MTIPEFETIFAVPLTCESCIQSVSTSLYKIPGISHVDANLATQLVSIRGTAAPSSIVNAIQDTGKDAILRGSGRPDSAAVCILETHSPTVADPVRGLVRMVQVSPSLTLFDITLRGVRPGTYHCSIRTSGDISRGAASTGSLWDSVTAKEEKREPRGLFGTIEVGKSGMGMVFTDKPVQVWEMIGRSFVVSAQQGEQGRENGFAQGDEHTLVGVIARSAGVWENDKTVCSCSGKTVWDERGEQRAKGMV